MSEIFISHIALEADLALVLKEWIERAFPKGKVHAFVSSSPDDIKAGEDWLKVTKNAPKSARVLVILCSKISIYSPWIFFEAGYGWSHELPVMPICHGDQEPGRLPLPLGLFQALQISNTRSSEELITKLARFLRVTKLRSVDYRKMAAELATTAQSVATKVSTLQAIKRGKNWVGNTPLKLAQKVLVSQTEMQNHLDALEGAGYVKKAWSSLLHANGYSLKPKGEQLLQQGYNY